MVEDVVVGAGIGGLAVAHRLRQLGREVVVLEASSRAGGVIRTVRRDGLVLEQGPQTLQTSAEAVQLVSELGLMSRVVSPARSAARRYVLWGGRLEPVPSDAGGLLRSPLLPPRTVMRALAEPAVPRRTRGPETVSDFVARRFGRGVLPVLDAFVAGVFAGDPREIEVDSAFPDLVRAEAEAGSVLRGMPGIVRDQRRRTPVPAPRPMFTFVDGMQELPDALARELGRDLRLDCPVEALEPGDRWTVHAGGPLEAERVWLACPLDTAAKLLGAPDLTVPRAPMAVIQLAWPREQVTLPPGFGWLAPSSERRDVLGCLWVSSVFPGHAPGRSLLRVMVGGARMPDLATWSPDALVAHARRVLRDVQGIEAPPEHVDVVVHAGGIPQYPLGHAAAVASWQARWPGLRLVGWGTTGIGVGHAIRAARELVG